MPYGICHLSLIPVRAKPSDKSEMVNQLLFGESFEIIEEKDNWIKVNTAWDDYKGWIDNKQYQGISDGLYKELNSSVQPLSLDPVQLAFNDKRELLIARGSTLPGFVETTFYIDKEKYHYKGMVADPQDEYDANSIVEFSKLYLGVPYLWGGRSPFGIDCSGFTQIVFQLAGIKLKRDAVQQAGQGTKVEDIENSKMGDLAFFTNTNNKISHAGIILGDSQIIHASGQVKIDKIDEKGIYNYEQEKYTHQLNVIKRLQ